jgi:hypothetical protein
MEDAGGGAPEPAIVGRSGERRSARAGLAAHGAAGGQENYAARDELGFSIGSNCGSRCGGAITVGDSVRPMRPTSMPGVVLPHLTHSRYQRLGSCRDAHSWWQSIDAVALTIRDSSDIVCSFLRRF